MSSSRGLCVKAIRLVEVLFRDAERLGRQVGDVSVDQLVGMEMVLFDLIQ